MIVICEQFIPLAPLGISPYAIRNTKRKMDVNAVQATPSNRMAM